MDIALTANGRTVTVVDAVNIYEEAARKVGRGEINLKEFWKLIQPLRDVEVVVRCKDCKHYQFADNRAFGFPVKRCEWTGFEDVDDEDFCSRGERKDGDHHDTK